LSENVKAPTEKGPDAVLASQRSKYELPDTVPNPAAETNRLLKSIEGRLETITGILLQLVNK
jgi:hypothetical protein